MLERICIILVVNLIFYFKTLRYNYVSDDIPIFQTSQKELKEKPLKTLRDKVRLRWQQVIGSNRVNQMQDHAITMVIHAIICVFIYLAFGRNDISFLAGLLFTFNPMNNQCSIWISGRGYTLPALLILIALTFPLTAPLALFCCASFTIGYLAPLVLLGGSGWLLLAVMPFIWAYHWKHFKGAVGSKVKGETVPEDTEFRPRKLILATKTVGWYFINCLVPYRIAFFHNFLQSCAGNEIMKKKAYALCRYFWVGFTLIAGFIAYAVLVPWSITHYGLLWFFIAILPFSNLRRNNQEIADRFVYIANIGLMVALASLLSHFFPLAYGWICLYAGVMWTVMGMYKDDYWVVEFSVMNDPHAWFSWHTHAMKRWDNKSFKEALIFWVMAKLISPKEFKLLYNIAVVLRVLNNIKESDEFLKQAEACIIKGQERDSMWVINELRKGKGQLLM